MADEELLDGDEEQKDPEEEQNQEQDSAQEQAPESEASESADKAPQEPQGEVAVDQEEPEQDEKSDQAGQESEGESSEDDSVDDLVEQQMLAELEKLESEETAGGEGAAEQSAGGGEEEIEQGVQRPEFPSFGQTTSASEQKNLDLLLDVNLPISIELGRTSMKIKEILSLGPGSVVELKKLAGEPVDLLVNNKIVAKGEVVVVDENFGLRITSLLSPEERLRSLE